MSKHEIEMALALASAMADFAPVRRRSSRRIGCGKEKRKERKTERQNKKKGRRK